MYEYTHRVSPLNSWVTKVSMGYTGTNDDSRGVDNSYLWQSLVPRLGRADAQSCMPLPVVETVCIPYVGWMQVFRKKPLSHEVFLELSHVWLDQSAE